MKNSIFKSALIILSVSAITYAKADTGVKVPAPVSNAYTTSYPQAKLKEWTIAHDAYIVKFKLNRRKCTAVFASDGKLVKTETELNNTKELPADIKNALNNSKYASFFIDDIKQVNIRGESKYVLTIDNHGGQTMASEGYGSWEDYQITYNGDGNILSIIEQ